MTRSYSVTLAPTAFNALAKVRDRKTRASIAKEIDGLAQDPSRKGKPLEAPPLEGLHAARVVRERYRILYEIDEEGRRVVVLFVGERRPGSQRDVYARAARLLAVLLQGGSRH